MSVNAKNLTVEEIAADGADGTARVVLAAAEEPVEVQIDPQLLAQATQNKNARLIAMMVHENAMYEVALEQSNRARLDAEAKYEALLTSMQDD